VSWASNVVPSRNSTFVTVPSGSLAIAVIVIVGLHGKIAPFAGDVMLTVGEALLALTVIVDATLVVIVTDWWDQYLTLLEAAGWDPYWDPDGRVGSAW
jgi:hypothetical protein